MNSESFVDYVRAPVVGVKPFPILAGVGICLGLGLIDSVGCVVSVIAAFVFVKMGHKGLGMMLAITNCLMPDMLPLVDEIGGVIAVVIPLYTGWKNQNSLADTVRSTIESHQEYQGNKEAYSSMSGLDVAETVATDISNAAQIGTRSAYPNVSPYNYQVANPGQGQPGSRPAYPNATPYNYQAANPGQRQPGSRPAYPNATPYNYQAANPGQRQPGGRPAYPNATPYNYQAANPGQRQPGGRPAHPNALPYNYQAANPGQRQPGGQSSNNVITKHN